MQKTLGSVFAPCIRSFYEASSNLAFVPSSSDERSSSWDFEALRKFALYLPFSIAIIIISHSSVKTDPNSENLHQGENTDLRRKRSSFTPNSTLRHLLLKLLPNPLCDVIHILQHITTATKVTIIFTCYYNCKVG